MDMTILRPVETKSLEESEKPDFRRCSTRLLNANLRKTLRQLHIQEHKARVEILKNKYEIYYKRQRICECVVMSIFLFTFILLSIYVIFASGFPFRNTNTFEMFSNLTQRIVAQQNENIELMCQTNQNWEWCRWIHQDSYCDIEWTPSSKNHFINCNFPRGKVEFVGNISNSQCGLLIKSININDRGLWQCEIEKYYFGFSRRYGEVNTFEMKVVVIVKNNSLTLEESTLETSSSSFHLFNSTNETHSKNEMIVQDMTEEEVYQRKFLILKISILGAVGLVLVTLASMFWIYFTYLWRTWDVNNKSREANCVSLEEGVPMTEVDLFEDSLNDAVFSKRLMESRRKSVSYAIMTFKDKETNSFDINQKSVRLTALREEKSSGNTSHEETAM